MKCPRFLLADLHIKHVCNQLRASDSHRALECLPDSIFHFYDDSLRRIDQLNDQEREFALRALSYVFCAKRPLSKDELIHALSIDPLVTDMASDELYDDLLIFSVSSGLICVDKKSKLVRLAHLTLHEYLQKYPEKLLESHEKELASACLSYLSLESLATGPCKEPADMIKRLDSYCFLDYACRHWPYHAADNISDEMMEAILLILRDNNRVATCAQVLYLPRHQKENWHDKFPGNFTGLHAAAYWGLDKVLGILLNHHRDIDCQDSHGMTPLIFTASHGHAQATRRLLEANASVDTPNNCGETALILAAKSGHEAMVKLLLQWDANPIAEDTESWTAIHWAIIGRHNNIVKALLGAAAANQSDIAQRNKALILAAEAGSDVIAQMLLDEGADVDYVDDQKSTPLHWAVPEGHYETSRVLLANGADPNSRDLYLNTPMHWAISKSAIAQLLHDKGANMNAKNNEGQSPLLWAALAGRMDAVQTMVELGANIQDGDRFGFTVLHAAVLMGHEPMVQFLLSQGADANAIDNDGWTPLHAAAVNRRSAVIDVLVKHTNEGHEIASRLAQRLKDGDMQALMEEMADRKSAGSTVVSGLRSAINGDSIQRLLKLLEDGADIDAVDEIGGSTALTHAAWFERDEAVRLLLNHGAAVDLRERSGRTALHWAASSGNKSMVIDLVEQGGATVDLKIFGWTAMLLAARMWHAQVVIYLIEQGADLRTKDFHGRSALHWACIQGDERLVEMLIGFGAGVNARDHCGQAPLHWAIAGRYLSIAKLLLRSNAQYGDSTADGSTALHIAAYTGQYDAVSMLLAAGEREQRRKKRSGSEVAPGKAVDVYKQDKDGFTALDMAELTFNMDIAKLLLSNLAPTSDQDSALIISLEDESLIRPSSEPPLLQSYTDETSDYLTDDNLFNGLGRPIFGPDVRKWLLSEQAKWPRLHGLQGFGLLSLESR
jgi:ankyrin repeat domain-containing protein 50